MKRSVREILFFLSLFLLFYIAVDMGGKCLGYFPNRESCYLSIGVVYTLCAVLLYFIAKLDCKNSEGFWNVSPYALCKGGPYMWQGDSDQAKMCRGLSESVEGRAGISSYNCSKGYNGQPMLPFDYTPLSDASWQNARCEDKPECGCKDVGLCSMEAQV